MLDKNWFSEPFADEGLAFSLKITDKLEQVQTKYQNIEIYQTDTFGKLMVIDGCVMLTSRDNFIYHEMMSHPALSIHPDPQNVLIIGGGDCGTMREVLKHKGVLQVHQVDIDEQVTRLSEKYFPELCASNNDFRANLHFEDGVKWVRDAKDGEFDVVIIDSTDPVGPAEGLFKGEFFTQCCRILKDGGIYVQQSESPLLHAGTIIKNMRTDLQNSGFRKIQTLSFPQCSYPSGWWSCTLASKELELDQCVNFVGDIETKYYNREVHSAAKAIPQFCLQFWQEN
ncbi:MAG: polyamine aminopropyltransferase [Gammaproteobacteria bacterium]|nr:MAG: polyamine aminopropyltransferase [Gammaproteobacteria bacterium]